MWDECLFPTCDGKLYCVSEDGNEPTIEVYLYTCIKCGRLIFICDSPSEIDTMFEAEFNGRQVDAIRCQEQDYARARFPPDFDLAGPVYVSKSAEIYMFRDGRWKNVYNPATKKRGYRGSAALPHRTKKTFLEAAARVVNFAWRDLYDKPDASVEHVNDDVDDDSYDNTKIGDAETNSKTRNRLRREGKQPDNTWIEVKIQRKTRKRLTKLTQLKGKKLYLHIDRLLTDYLEQSDKLP